MSREIEQVPDMSPDLREAALARLEETFPGSVVEGQVDFERLRQELVGDESSDGERYIFDWAGKRSAAELLQMRSAATLIPDDDGSIGFETTSHAFVEGENLEVLKLLYKAYFGRVRLIYVDPPYNTGEDRIYGDDYRDPLGHYLAITGQLDEEGNLLTSNPETSGRYHSTWLSMLYPRLALARQLLREDGFLVVSIDDTELHHLRLILNEALGEENYVATLVWDRNRKNDATFFSVGHEYMVVYARNLQYLKDSGVILRAPKEGVDEVRELWDRLRDEHGDDFEAIQAALRDFLDEIPDDDPRKPLRRFRKVSDTRGPYRDDVDISWPGGGGPTYDVPHPVTGRPCKLPRRGWVYPTLTRMEEEIEKDNVAFGPDETTVPALKSHLFEKEVQVMRSVNFSYAQTAAQAFDALFEGVRVFDNPKHFEDMRTIVDYLTDEEDLVLDFFAGSGSTGHGVFDSNRRNSSRRTFVLVQLQEPVDTRKPAGKNAEELGLHTISDIAEDRLRRVVVELGASAQTTSDVEVPEDLGFRVFRLARSNFKPWPEPDQEDLEEYAQQMAMSLDRLEENWSPQAVVWEIALREGYPLSSTVQTVKAAGCDVFALWDPLRGRRFFVCLDDAVPLDLAHELGLAAEEVLVCRDSALTDEAAANLALQCRLKTV